MLTAWQQAPIRSSRATGEMARLMAAKDWASTPLGPSESWTQSLRTSVAIMLRSRYPMILTWGEQLVMLYNDAFIPTLGAKHPRAIGGLLSDEFAEVWDEVGPMQRSVLAGGPAVWAEDLPLAIERGVRTRTGLLHLLLQPRARRDGPGWRARGARHDDRQGGGRATSRRAQRARRRRQPGSRPRRRRRPGPAGARQRERGDPGGCALPSGGTGRAGLPQARARGDVRSRVRGPLPRGSRTAPTTRSCGPGRAAAPWSSGTTARPRARGPCCTRRCRSGCRTTPGRCWCSLPIRCVRTTRTTSGSPYSWPTRWARSSRSPPNARASSPGSRRWPHWTLRRRRSCPTSATSSVRR